MRAGPPGAATGEAPSRPPPEEAPPREARPVGLLALQGGFDAHRRALDRLAVPTRLVRRPEDLSALSGLVLPGGESTTQLALLVRFGLRPALLAFLRSGRPVLGTCAGLILLSRPTETTPEALGVLDVEVRRNGWGRQVDSFSARSEEGRALRFIRAPRIVATGPAVEILDRLGGEPVLLRTGQVYGATYHPELTSDLSLHRQLFGAAAPVGALSAASAGPRCGSAGAAATP